MSTRRAFEPIVHVLAGMAGRIRVSGGQRRTERQLARFSPHLLRDIGFERDWDGSVRRNMDLN